MNEKLSFQNIADSLAQKAGVQKKVAESFSKAFFDTIVEVLSTGEPVKIKGLGTFKLVEVGDRESVNVSTGMRFVIPGYKKVAFTAEDSVVEALSGHTDNTDTSDVESLDAVGEEQSAQSVQSVFEKESKESVQYAFENKEQSVSEKEPDIDELIQVPEPEQVEQPQDSFAGIDILISTPESVEDIRQQYEEAKAKMETAVEEARKANAEKLRLEKLLDRLEKNLEPEMVGYIDHTNHTDKEEITEAEVHYDEAEKAAAIFVASMSEDKPSEEEKRQQAFNRVMVEQPRSEEESEPKKSSKKHIGFIFIILLLVAVLGVFIYLIYRNIEAVEHVQTVEQPTKTVQPATKPAQPSTPVANVNKDSLANTQKADSVKAQKVDSGKVAEKPQKEADKSNASNQVKEEKPERPKTHRIQRGESLTRISQKYYGTKDSVRAILRINHFANPDNIPVGAVVKLP